MEKDLAKKISMKDSGISSLQGNGGRSRLKRRRRSRGGRKRAERARLAPGAPEPRLAKQGRGGSGPVQAASEAPLPHKPRIWRDSSPGPGAASMSTDVGRRTLIPPSCSFPAVIRVIGVGGAGVNAINRMLEAGLEGVEFIAIETDAQALATCEAGHKIRIGADLTKGLGSGSDPKVGREAALAAYDEIKNVLRGSELVSSPLVRAAAPGLVPRRWWPK